jgi:hypothetical protein
MPSKGEQLDLASLTTRDATLADLFIRLEARHGPGRLPHPFPAVAQLGPPSKDPLATPRHPAPGSLALGASHHDHARPSSDERPGSGSATSSRRTSGTITLARPGGHPLCLLEARFGTDRVAATVAGSKAMTLSAMVARGQRYASTSQPGSRASPTPSCPLTRAAQPTSPATRQPPWGAEPWHLYPTFATCRFGQGWDQTARP